MHIGIYINNENISGVDCSDMMKGNPGVGGTEYCLLLLAQTYKEFFPENKLTLFAAKKGKLPTVDSIVTVEGLNKLCEKATEENVDVLVVSAVYNNMPLPKSFFEAIDKMQIKTILWGHNFYLSDFCNLVSKTQYLRANVFVGRQQYDRYVDHKVIKKSTFIYNMYPEAKDGGRNAISNHSVTYIGALVPTKGFHVLANAWKNILEIVPDAQLNVIGSGKLYGRNYKLGKYGIAEESYEKEFMPGLVNDQGEILPSVHFLGVLGAEKKEVIKLTSVGVVNPSGRTETFGISALDFESLGVPVVTIAKGGFLDTVIDGRTGLLYHNTADLANCVAELLCDREKNIRSGQEGIRLAASFAPQMVISEWHALFEKVCHDEKLPYKKPDSFMKTNLKWLRCANRAVKEFLHLEYPMSVIGLETFARNVLRRVGK